MNYSRQREMIRQTLLEHPVHPTADIVYQMVRGALPRVSLATIYRNLNQLAAQGALQRIVVPGSSDHFDARLDEHSHLSCNICKRLVDLPPVPLDQLRESLLRMAEFSVTDVQLYITGICPECNKK